MSDRRQEVIDVAKQLFVERGIKQTTVREIGAKAGILSGSLYHHFRSKDDIVDFILRDFCADVLEHYREISLADVESAAQLRMLARYGFSLLEDHSAEIVILQDDYVDLTKFPQNKDPRFSYLVDFNNEVGQRWLDAIAAGIKAGIFKPDVDARLLYRVFRDAILGATRWYVPHRAMETDQIADSIVDIVLNGILVASPGR